MGHGYVCITGGTIQSNDPSNIIGSEYMLHIVLSLLVRGFFGLAL